MPMKRNFTLLTINEEQKNSTKTGKQTTVQPAEETLNFIRQFARVYQFEPSLDQGLCSYIVN